MDKIYKKIITSVRLSKESKPPRQYVMAEWCRSKSAFSKIAISFIFLVLLFNFSQKAGATIYQPGETLEPDCAPGSVNCGVAIFSLNGQATSTQTFITGISGTDFNIVSGLGVHTFNIPDASAIVRGLLTASDWGIFYAKQNALGFIPVSSTTTINSQALTGNITLSAADIPDSSNKRYVTDVQLILLGNTSGTNTGDESSSTIMAKLGITTLSGSNTGDVTIGTGNGLSLSGQVLSVALSSASTTGTLSSLDWNAFNDKQTALGYVPLNPANNLSDLTSTSSARTNLGLGSLAALSSINNSNWSGTPLAVANGGTGTTNGSITGTGALSFTSNTTNALTLDSGTTGAVNLGTNANAKTITIGNSTGATALNLTSGTELQTFTSSGTTGGAFSFIGNSVTTGNALAISATALTTGSAMSITASGPANNAGTNNALNISLITPADSSGTNTHQGININSIIGNATAGTNVVNLINTSAVTGDAEVTLNAINIGNLTGTAAAENGLVFGTGWDNEIKFNNSASNIQLGATDNTAVFNIVDNCSSGCVNGGTLPNSLFKVRDFATNFGGLVESGAFVENNSYYGQEFSADTSNAITADSATIGDDTRWYFDTTNNTMSYTAFDGVGGFGRLTGGTTSGVGGMIGFGDAQNNLSLIFSKASLPVVQMKVRTNVNNANNDIFWGLMNQATAPAVNDTKPANGIYFWNNNAAGGWQGVVRSGGADVGTVTCPGAISTTQFAVGRIQVESATVVRFLIDNDVSDGVGLTDCGTVSGTNPTAALGLAIYNIHTETTGSRTVDIDYARVWQDDIGDLASALAENVSEIPVRLFDNNGQMIDGASFIKTVSEEVSPDVLTKISDYIQTGLDFTTDFIAARITTIRGYFNEVFAKKVHTEQLCVKKSDGSEVCVNGDQVNSLLQNANITPVVNPAPSNNETAADNPESASSSTPEVINEPIPTDPISQPSPPQADTEGTATETPTDTPTSTIESTPPETSTPDQTAPPAEPPPSEPISPPPVEQPPSPAPVEAQQ